MPNRTFLLPFLECKPSVYLCSQKKVYDKNLAMIEKNHLSEFMKRKFKKSFLGTLKPHVEILSRSTGIIFGRIIHMKAQIKK